MVRGGKDTISLYESFLGPGHADEGSARVESSGHQRWPLRRRWAHGNVRPWTGWLVVQQWWPLREGPQGLTGTETASFGGRAGYRVGRQNASEERAVLANSRVAREVHDQSR